MGRLRRAGMQQVRAIEHQIDRLNQQRQALLSELGTAISAVAPNASRREPASGRRRAEPRRLNQVFAKLPKTSFKASDVRAIVPNVAAGTLSQRLTGWVKEKKLKRTGTRRGTSLRPFRLSADPPARQGGQPDALRARPPAMFLEHASSRQRP